MSGGTVVGEALVSGAPIIRNTGGRALGRALVRGGRLPVINPEYLLIAGECPVMFRTKLPAGSVNLGMDMAGELPPGVTITDIDVTAAVIIGCDENPEDILVGNPGLNGTTIVQRVEGGIAGNTYALSFIVTTSDGEVLICQGFLPVSQFGGC